MSSHNPSAIRAAIRELLEGEIGSVRTLPQWVFKYGTFIGQPDDAMKAFALDHRYKHRFDVSFAPLQRHGATPLSHKSSVRIDRLDVTIDIVTTLRSTVDEDARNAQRELIEQNAELALQALMYPGNLEMDSKGRATGLVSGFLQGRNGDAHPSWEVVSEDWTLQLHRSRILGSAVVVIAQAIA